MDGFKNEISSPKKGMSKGVDPRNLSPTDYTHALNTTLTNDDGDYYDLTYEKSNIKEVVFPTGYKVIGRFNRLLKNYTYYFLHNPISKYSLFGYVDNNVVYNDHTDEELPTPLEQTTQTPYKNFVPLIDDSCFDSPTKGFNFDINFPIQNVLVKEQKTGGVAYFTDVKNKPRYIELDNIVTYFTQEEPCDDDVEVTCPIMDKMLLHKEYELPIISEVSISSGGSLKKGVYSFLISLSDSLGNEISEYFSQTQYVDIFSNSETDITDKAIRVKTESLDKNYTHYKIVVVFSDKLDGATTYYNGGVFSVNDSEIVISDISSMQRVSNESISYNNQRVLKSEGFTTANKSLLEYGLVFERELNLQPIANLLGSFLQWQTHIAKEDLYSFGEGRNKYGGINRGETVPYGIRFLRTGGTTTPIFPLVGREPIASDLQLVPEADINRQSIEVSETCADTIRDKRWQIFDTATVTDTNTVGSETYTVDTTKDCTVIDAFSYGAGSFSFPQQDEDIVDIDEYIRENLPTCDGHLQGSDLCDFYTSLDCTDASCETDSQDTCSSVLNSCSVEIGTIVNPRIERGVNTLFNYPFLQPDCDYISDPYIRPVGGNIPQSEPLSDLFTLFMRIDNINNNAKSRELLSDVNYLSDNTTGSITNGCSDFTSSDYVIFDCDDHSNYLGNYVSNDNLLGGLFSTNINTRAQWFKIDYKYQGNTNNSELADGIVLSFSALINEFKTYNGEILPQGTEDYPINNTYRVSLFNGLDYNVDAFHSFTYNAAQGMKVLLYEEGGSLHVKVGNNPVEIFANTSYDEIHIAVEQAKSNFVEEFDNNRCIIHPVKGAYKITTAPMKLGDKKGMWDSITFNVVNTYTETCEYSLPSIGNCEGLPYQKGDFAYTEQQSIYPDNPELYDSSGMIIDLDKFPVELRAEVQEKILNGTGQVRESFNLTCQPIRHFRFPSNNVSPFMSNNSLAEGQETYIYPLGATIDERFVNSFLDIAVDNGLINEDERATIYGYEIFRGDLTVTRSVVASGLLYDLREYEEKGKKISYSNYPYNSRGADVLNNMPTPTGAEHFGSGFTFHSPETDYYFRENGANEMSIEGYQFGSSFGHFDEVEDHPKWTVLTKKAENIASTLATAEVASEVMTTFVEAASNVDAIWYTTSAGVGSTGGGTNFEDSGIKYSLVKLNLFLKWTDSIFKYARYKQQWMDIIEGLGVSSNLASYYFSRGDYNYLETNYTSDNTIRGLQTNKPIKDGRLVITNKIKREDSIELNNIDREWSTLINIGKDYKLNYPTNYLNHETSSITYQSAENHQGNERVGRSPEVIKNISSPYVQMRRYSSDQHGSISSISWVTTSYKGMLNNPQHSWLPIFGGDTLITRHTLKRKIPLFLTTAMGQSDTTAFKYSFYNNIGQNPKFFVDYKTDNYYSKSSLNLFPIIRSRYNTDNQTDSKFYLKEPSKIYLYYYGVPNFLAETRINTNYRESGRELRQQFFPEIGDIGRWTQESSVRLREPNYFKYSATYSKGLNPFNSRTLSDSYKKERQDVIESSVNGVIFSLPDYDENGQRDPWLKFLPLDYYEFDSQYGKLKELKGIEGEAILGRFEHTTVLFNKVDSKVDDGQSPSTFLGGRSIFQRRTASFVNSELGYGGTSHKESLSCEYGHFHVDNKRGQIVQIPPGGGRMTEISFINTRGELSNMKEWFKRHLPYKILNSNIGNSNEIPTDNSYNGIGMSFGWDSTNKRVLITKRDYEPVVQGVTYEKGEGFKVGDKSVYLDDNEVFRDVSWTIGYYPTIGHFSSFYSYNPNYYTNHANYFSTGVNSMESTWSHNVTNKSAGVFFGIKYPMEVELVVKSGLKSYIGSVGLLTESKRYLNNEDFILNNEVTFNKSVIYNRKESSGNLILDLCKGHTRYLSSYPIGVDQKTQRIPLTRTEDMFNYNYFYNRVNKTVSTPVVINDRNEIGIEVNNADFYQRGGLERLNGDYFLNRLTYDKDSRYLLTIKISKSFTNLDLM